MTEASAARPSHFWHPQVTEDQSIIENQIYHRHHQRIDGKHLCPGNADMKARKVLLAKANTKPYTRQSR